MRTKSPVSLESGLAAALSKFETEYMGRGPEETRVYVIDDMVFVRLKGVLTVAEKQLSKNFEGKMLIKQTRARLLENARPLLEALVSDATGARLKALHTDISTVTGERVIIFVMDRKLR